MTGCVQGQRKLLTLLRSQRRNVLILRGTEGIEDPRDVSTDAMYGL